MEPQMNADERGLNSNLVKSPCDPFPNRRGRAKDRPAIHLAIRVHLRSSAVAFVLFLSSVAHGQRQAQLPWWDRTPARQIGAYWIKSDLPAEQVNAIGRHLNLMHREFNAALAGVPVRVQEKLDVYVFANRDEWEFIVRTRFAMNPPESGGFLVSASEHCLAFFVDGLSARQIDQIMQREGFRQFAYNRFERDLPLWLAEGMADMFGDAVLMSEALLLGQSTPRMLDEAKAAVAAGTHIPFATILNITPQEWATQRAARPGEFIWHQSRLMAQFLMQAPQPFAIYLRHLNNGLPHDHALTRAFGMDAPSLEQQWKRYVTDVKPGSLATALERIEFLAHGLLELHKRNLTPASINDLRDALRAIDFTLQINTLHGSFRMSAADDAMFQIPQDALCGQQPIFVLSRTRSGGGTQRQRDLERASPAPPTVATQNLRPSQLRIQWLRSEQGEFSYEIIMR